MTVQPPSAGRSPCADDALLSEEVGSALVDASSEDEVGSEVVSEEDEGLVPSVGDGEADSSESAGDEGDESDEEAGTFACAEGGCWSVEPMRGRSCLDT